MKLKNLITSAYRNSLESGTALSATAENCVVTKGVETRGAVDGEVTVEDGENRLELENFVITSEITED